MSSTRKTETAPRFRVGDWVAFRHRLWETARIQVIEDRGPLGVGGERIYRVRVEIPHADPTTFETREGELEAATASDEQD